MGDEPADPPFVWRADQTKDLDPAFVSRSGFHFRTVFHRSREFQLHDLPAQDYLTYTVTRDAVCWVVADGVSGSFFGDIAARIAGDEVLAWLSQVSLARSAAGDLESALRRVLSDAVVPGRRAVQEFALPSGLPPRHRDSLERQRPSGSQTMVACGRIERGRAAGGRVSMFVASLGDMRTRWQADDVRGELRQRTADRWSTRTGVKGELECHVAYDVSRLHVSAYSDGLAALDGTRDLTSTELEDRIALAKSAPSSDDMCLFEVWNVEPSHLQESLPPPQVQVVAAGQEVRASWTAVAGASHYVVELSGRETDRFLVSGQRWSRPDLIPGTYHVRVYGVEQRTGSRSEAQAVSVAASAPPHDTRIDEPDDAFEAAIVPLIEPAYRLACGLLASHPEAAIVLGRAVRDARREFGVLGPGPGLIPWFMGLVGRRCRSQRRGRRWRAVTRRVMGDRAAGRGDTDSDPRLRQAARAFGDRERALVFMLSGQGFPADRVARTLAVTTGKDEATLRHRVEHVLEATNPPPRLRADVMAAADPRPAPGIRGRALAWIALGGLLAAVAAVALARILLITAPGPAPVNGVSPRPAAPGTVTPGRTPPTTPGSVPGGTFTPPPTGRPSTPGGDGGLQRADGGHER